MKQEEDDIVKLEEREERKVIEEAKKLREKEERMRREEGRKEAMNIDEEDIHVQVIQETDNSEPSRGDGADIIKEVFEVTHDAVMITDIEMPETLRDDEKEELKEKKKKKKKDKDLRVIKEIKEEED